MIVLKGFNTNTINSGWNVTNGVKWRVVKSNTNHVKQIQVICPKCGKIGNLWRVERRGDRGFWIIHDKKRYKKCHFGWSSEYYETLKEIYILGRGLFP